MARPISGQDGEPTDRISMDEPKRYHYKVHAPEITLPETAKILIMVPSELFPWMKLGAQSLAVIAVCVFAWSIANAILALW
uniref:Uncharacterized protein n=1 Tax=viral metagenome TaxID=1070528 RepID=A0A6M3JBQ8_9ZZZZ